MGFWAAAAPYIASAAGAYLTNMMGQQNADTAWERSQQGAAWAYENYKRRYQDTSADMYKAGLNPILAASGGFNVSGQPAAPTPTISPTPQVDFASSAKSYSEVDKNKQTIINMKKDAELTIKKTEETVQKAEKLRREQKLITAQEQVALKQYWAVQAQFKKDIQQAYLSIEKQDLTRKQIKNLELQAKKLQAQLEKLSKISNVYKSDFGNILTFVGALMESFNARLSN